MKILICWTHVSGYMAACWRALAGKPGIELSVLAFSTQETSKSDVIGFNDEITRGLNVRLLAPDQHHDFDLIASHAASIQPDIVVIAGWAYPAYRRLVAHPALSGARFVMTMDTPLRGGWRQYLGRLSKLHGLRDRLDRVFVAGERAFQLARYFKVPEAKIRRGLYGFDGGIFDPSLHARRLAQNNGAWPKNFLFIARYVHQKAMDMLADGYALYRGECEKRGEEAWPLTCCGRGPESVHIAGRPGITDIGYVQPDGLPDVLLRHGVFVISSRYEPWGVAVAEAMASGLPVIATLATGAVPELVRDYYNGVLVTTEDPASLSRAFTM